MGRVFEMHGAAIQSKLTLIQLKLWNFKQISNIFIIILKSINERKSFKLYN